MAKGKNSKPDDAGAPAAVVRPLEAGDLDRVVAIDEALTGRSRRGFFERRLKAALKEPRGFIYVGSSVDGKLAAYALVRLLGGEFGQDDAGMLDAIGVDPQARGKGLGRGLLAAIDEVMRHKGVHELHTETEWTNAELLGFLAHSGFERAPRIVLTRDVGADLNL
jgi:GNAT superfamily N-acetyltransferase